MTTDLASKSPSEIDTDLFPLWADRWSAGMKKYEARKRIEESDITKARQAAGEKLDWREKFKILDAYSQKSAEKDLEKYTAEVDALNAKIAPFEDEFKKRGGWERYVFVPDGHLHFQECSTCYPTTERLLVAEASGKNRAEIVDKFDYAACTVCFPEAPVEARAKYLRDRSDAKKAERDEKRAAKAAKEAEKMLLEPVKVQGWRGIVRSVYDAKTDLKSDIEYKVWDEKRVARDAADAMRIAHNSLEREHDIAVLSEALRAKGFDVDTMIAKWEKAARKS